MKTILENVEVEVRHYSQLIKLFNGLFKASHQTVLELGDDEPIYLPRSEDQAFHRIIFAHGYFSSALHEIAHWCVAGKKRRQLIDFGYWYKPDGRTEAEQRAFEQVEVKPQALEWAFSSACGHKFQFSADNLNGDVGDMSRFKTAVRTQLGQYLLEGFPKRAALLIEAMTARYGTTHAFRSNPFDPARH